MNSQLKEQLREETFSLEAFIFVIILVIYILTSHFIEVKRVPYLHESTIAIFMGVLTAAFAQYGLGAQIRFSDELFFAIILPPIIFSAGYSLRKSLFFENFGMIGFLGIFGTIIGFVCMTAFLIVINSFIFNALTLTELMMISSVLCATDTVAAMALIKPDKYPVLNAVLFGEGIINDAVAIILFRTISGLNLGETSEITFQIVFKMFFDFTYLFFFSVAFGTVSGFGLSYVFKRVESFNKSPLKETSLILLNGYFTYLIGELLGLSGIITLFTCAIIMGHYCFMNISEESQKGTGLAFQTVGFIAEAFVFAYLGASTLSIHGKWTAVFMAFMIFAAMPFIRAIMVYFMPLVYRLMNRPFPMNSHQLKVCWYSGMVRGVIAFALCLQIRTKHKTFIVTVALVLVMMTTIIGSTMLKSFMKWIGFQEEQNEDNEQQILNKKKLSKFSQKQIGQKYKAMGAQGTGFDIGSAKERTGNKLEMFEEKYVKPLFEKNKESDEDLDLGDDNHKIKRMDEPGDAVQQI